ncbi:MAG: hypothetical protein P1S46_00185 [bacterium]|nr:hypothetical protein [bacterium]MDT8395233.1 hypothetical protein [bacterium]
MAQIKGGRDELLRSVREILAGYGRDYAIGAIRGLAVRNMLSVTLPEATPGFYPIVKVHDMALRELEEVFYGYLQDKDDGDRETIVALFVAEKVWE